ncbi:tRNA (adenosine(37)-N6)-dimethylallyltransferase MiaA [Pusillimonas caeni]|uniref:tRNA (adenosine(37)-N6)-dimethylallyltransferase MiaA n=1 Tax=Pusillimonas caeni TaxID=1348472 RepID=UPI000E5995B2|nr:tRNA (adenosine(37)-N6)-dimethylallyltransferase MiaA [Pusillimonas caeni]TFL13987.1 tRNA (adenosine(37)-N6)-dimethylallyltransferase MiaA [Pusillimonas caeni]
MSLPIVCIAGPTAAGKSASTLALAADWPIEIINVDSATIYRGMDIGTAKPSPEERELIPHHLLDIRDPAESYSAAAFRDDALRLIDEILARGRIPLLCGGTMLYYKALREGLDDLPRADPALRAQIDAQAREQGWPALHRELAMVDPRTAARLAPNDSQRIQRAVEIYRLTGTPMSELLAKRPAREDDKRLRYLTISLEPSDRLALHERIRQRYMAMVQAGLVEEVARLHRRPDLHAGLPSVRCVGYRQLWDYLDGATSLDEAIERAVAATRQLAKRQLTWLRSQPDRMVVDCLAGDAADQVRQLAGPIWRQDFRAR